jgi:hypothetical protein
MKEMMTWIFLKMAPESWTSGPYEYDITTVDIDTPL